MANKRVYQLKRRAERQEETRRRITAATVALHEEVGPARTTISAIAARAGVERLTVYRHFPEERDLLGACQEHFLRAHPLPEIGAWVAIDDPRRRLRTALTALYTRYRETEAMTAHILRDAPSLPALAELIEGMPRYFSVATDVLSEGWNIGDEQRPLLRALLGHALDFETWRSLARRQGLEDREAVKVMVRLIWCVAEHGPGGDENKPAVD